MFDTNNAAAGQDIKTVAIADKPITQVASITRADAHMIDLRFDFADGE